MSWRTIHIGDYVDAEEIHIQTGPFGTQLKASDYTETGTPVINVRNVGYGNLRPEKLEYVPHSVELRLSRHLLQSNDIVFGRKGAVDRHLFVKDAHNGWMQGSDCIRMRILTEKLVPAYVSYALRIERHRQWMLTQCSNKATMASLNQDVICRIPLKVPDPIIQQSIVEILSTYDDLIENNRRRIALLEESARLLYKEWFVHLRFPSHEQVKVVDGVPEGWERKPFGEICFQYKKTVKPTEVSPDTPYIGLEHIPRRSITLSEWETSEKVTSNKYVFEQGNILFGKIRPYFHKVGFALCNGITSSDAVVIRATEDKFYHYLLAYVSSDAFVQLASKTCREGSKMPRADWKFLEKQLVMIPSNALLVDFSEQVVPILSQLKVLALQNHKLAKARDLLLPRLMNGEIEV